MAKNFKLNNGLEIPPIGLGTHQVTDLEEILKNGFSIGYRLIDTARIYENEAEIGEILSKFFKEGIINRDELFVVSKLLNTNHKREEVIPAIKKSLNDLKLDCLDLYLIHWPVACKPTRNEIEKTNFIEDDFVTLEDTWKGMEECVQLGYAKSIGVSNFNSVQIERILKMASIKPVINQIECNPYFYPKEMIKFCQERNIVVMAYSPLYRPNKFPLQLLEEPILKFLGEKYCKSPAQIVLKYLVQLQLIPVTKTSKIEHLKKNFEIFKFILKEEDMQEVVKLHKNMRCNVQERFISFREYPFSIKF